MRRHPGVLLLMGAACLLQVLMTVIVLLRPLSSPFARLTSLAMLVCLLMLDVVVARMVARTLDDLSRSHELDVSRHLQESLANLRHQGERDRQLLRDAAQLVERELEQAQGSLAARDVEALDQHLATSLSLAGSSHPARRAPMVVAAVLDSKERQCAEAGVTLDAQVGLPEQLPLGDIEVASVFFNLIDNALHECEALLQEDADVHPHIHVRSSIEMGQLFVQVENPCRRDAEARHRAAARQEDAGRVHGWGTGIVEDIARRHGGVASFEAWEGSFCAAVLIPLRSGRQS